MAREALDGTLSAHFETTTITFPDKVTGSRIAGDQGLLEAFLFAEGRTHATTGLPSEFRRVWGPPPGRPSSDHDS
ncbi:hypothetical protein [Nonomuraea diastatica]|uniref:Uncharacterized protein n=1 Tax=Nonomuraea diastatica TaxID=1848329 RepID=A0A4V2YCV7_9ACTN|nr:hypothetical protein [Nonomuraea diastatica]TDD13016.1 hypothetical protein E1294_42510 [Nonomuraea diastatica]